MGKPFQLQIKTKTSSHLSVTTAQC